MSFNSISALRLAVVSNLIESNITIKAFAILRDYSIKANWTWRGSETILTLAISTFYALQLSIKILILATSAYCLIININAFYTIIWTFITNGWFIYIVNATVIGLYNKISTAISRIIIAIIALFTISPYSILWIFILTLKD